MAPGQRLELGNVVRIRKKADIENKIGVAGDSVPEAKAGHLDHDPAFVAIAPSNFSFTTSRSSWTVNFDVSIVTSARSRIGASALRSGFDILRNRGVFAERVRPARFAVAANEHVVRRLQKQRA